MQQNCKSRTNLSGYFTGFTCEIERSTAADVSGRIGSARTTDYQIRLTRY
jgi:hypothetical protein